MRADWLPAGRVKEGKNRKRGKKRRIVRLKGQQKTIQVSPIIQFATRCHKHCVGGGYSRVLEALFPLSHKGL